MIIDISIGIIAIAFVILVVFLVMTLIRLRKVLKKTDRVLSDVHQTLNTLSVPSSELIQNSNRFVLDLKRKSEGLDVLFRPLYALKKSESHSGGKFSDIAIFVTEGIHLFNKIKKEMKS